MATDDVQRLVTGEAAAPAHFLVPGNGQIKPKAIFASFDGTNAGGSFIPALKIISDGGETVAICPADSTLAAGASADVSWFHGIGGGGGGTSGATALATGYTSLTIGPNSQAQAVGQLAHVQGFFVNAATTNSAVMNWTTSSTQYDQLNLRAVGTYLLMLNCKWDRGTDASTNVNPNTSTLYSSGAGGNLAHLPFFPSGQPFVFGPPQQASVQDYVVVHNTGGTQVWTAQHTEVTNSPNNAVDWQWLTAIYWATG